MTKEQFILYMQRPELLDQDSIVGLKEMIEDYPYFQAARMLYLRNLRNINSYRFEAELVKHALFIPDRTMLFRLLNVPASGDEFQLLPFDQEVFDDLFEKENTLHADELELQTPAVYQFVADQKISSLSGQEKDPDLIDKFIAENPTIVPAASGQMNHDETENNQVEEIDDSLITETLAGIYVKQGLCEEALRAYEKLSLKFPEKNSYFASQIEKIKKLISKDL